jgi:methylmalonyl-CoA epimerase
VIVGIEHVAIASNDPSAAARVLRDLGMHPWHQEDLAAEGVRSNQFASGIAVIEILEPLRDDAPLQRFLAQRGPGLHHICFQVDDLDATIELFQALGLELVNIEPREDDQGRRVFLHPRSGHGVLMGFVERHTTIRGIQPHHRRSVNPGWRSFDGLTFVPAVTGTGKPLFTSGLTAIDDDGVLQAPGDVVGQTRVIYSKLAALLGAAGGSLADIVKTTDYILSRENYRATADVRREFLGPNLPAATGVIVKELLGRGVLIEIDAVALLPDP